jgi:hypothetical protein
MKKLFTLSVLFSSVFSFSQIGIGTTTPSKAALLDIASTTRGFLIPRMTNAQKGAIYTPPAGLQVWCSDCGESGETQVYNGSTWTSICGSAPSVSQQPMVGGDAFCDGIHTTTTVEVTSITGQIWMDRNLGASRSGISFDDYMAYGCLYQWGRGNDGHASINRTSATTGTVVNGITNNVSITDTPLDAQYILGFGSYSYDWRSDNNNSRWQTTGATNNNPCPSGFHVPTATQISAEYIAYNIIDNESAFNSPLKIVSAGSRGASSGTLRNQGIGRTFWSSTVNGILAFVVDSDTPTGGYNRTNGYSVRCIKD